MNLKKQYNIFVVDDDLADVELVTRAIKQHLPNSEVKYFSDGIEFLIAVDGFIEPLPDLLFLDLNMPGKSGHVVLNEVRSDVRWQRVPIVILSTSTSISDFEKSAINDANAYVVKLGDINAFNQEISETLDRWLECG